MHIVTIYDGNEVYLHMSTSTVNELFVELQYARSKYENTLGAITYKKTACNPFVAIGKLMATA